MTERIRGRRLQAIRARWFALHPFCVRCQEANPPRRTLATQLDHITPLHRGGLDFDRDNGTNRQGLCEPCHELKSAEDLGHKPKGCDADGWPTDPRHPWNAEPKP